MGIKIIDEKDPPLINENDKAIRVMIDNGDLAAIETLFKKMNFKDKESVLRFAIAALKVASEEGDLCVIRKDGSTKHLRPIDDLLNDDGGIQHHG